MTCGRCAGKMFLDRTYSDNVSFETYCIMCGDRKFVDKDTKVGQWLTQREAALRVDGKS